MKTILLVEDDATLRHAIDRNLTDAGYRVVAAEDTMAALEEISAHEIDLLLTDIVMPPGKPHGLALARMARIRQPGAPVMFMTGYHDVVAQGGDFPGKVFQKPVDIDVLLEAIGELFGASEAAGQSAPGFAGE
ncbi:MAG: hybrid sensor histidine kinase/response regulator [Rhodospirillales bacterium]|jgi:DNA-binding NtrC family response regulator|nr:hybrid sensor histidine kinase/response regulator [Rhodospirillales bacterium]